MIKFGANKKLPRRRAAGYLQKHCNAARSGELTLVRLLRIKGCLFLFLCIGFWIFTSSSIVEGARIAGEKGVTPATPIAKQKAQEPVEPKPPAKAHVQKDLSKAKEISIQEQVKEKRPDKRYVTIDFNNVDIAIFIKFISELTGKNFVIDKAVRGKVTIISPTKISVKEAYKVFESVLEVHGYTTVPSGSITKIVPAIQARSKDIETRLRKEAISPEDKVVTQLIPLKYADPNDLKKLFAPLISKTSVIVSYPPTGMLIVTDVLSNIKRLLRITEVVDVEGIGEEISVVPLKHATASDIAKSLNTVFKRPVRRAKKGVPSETIVRIVSDERTNSLITLASENDTHKIRKLIKLLDRKTPRGEGDIHVYYLQNANAEDLAKILMSIPSEQKKATKKGKQPVLSKETQIVADKATNSLIITAKRDDFVVLEEVIKKLDIPRRMVYIEALIMEVSVDKDFKLGVEWRGAKQTGSSGGGAIAPFVGSGGLGQDGSYTAFPSVDSTTGAIGFPTGFSMGILGAGIKIGDYLFPTLGAVLQAYQHDTDVHVLSTPQILTTDNEEAEIIVGKNVPYITKKDTTSADIDYTTYEYKDVGVSLKITPQISQDRFVRLNIFQEVTRLIETKGTTEGYPSTYKRTAQTTVIVKDSNTVVIGGLIGDDTTNIGYQVPCLGDIPLLGYLFKSASTKGEKTNLFIFLTPHIIENPEEAKKVYQEKKEEIDRIKEDVIKMYNRQPNKILKPKDK